MEHKRKWMLLALAALMIVAVAVPATAAITQFTDVPDANIFANDIQWMADNDVTKGCNNAGTLFCPQDNVTREQMSAFMRRLATGGAVDAGLLNGRNAADFDDAKWVDGYSANQIVRAFGASVDTEMNDFTSSTFTSVLADTVTAPVDGFLHITASIGAEDDCSLAGEGWLQGNLAVDGTKVFSSPWAFSTQLGDCLVDSQYGDTISFSAVVPVLAGSHTIDLYARDALNGSYLYGRSITTIFTPFGSADAIPLDASFTDAPSLNQP